MSEENKASKILDTIYWFSEKLATFDFDMDNFSENSQEIKTLNAWIQKCKMYSQYIQQSPPGNYIIDSDVNFDSDFYTDFDISKVLPVMEQIWNQYGEKLSNIMIYKMFTILKLSLMPSSAESISIEQIQRIFKLGENVLKSKIKFTESPKTTVSSICDVFNELIVIIENGDFQGLDIQKIFDMLCDISFDSVDEINDVEVINRKNYFASWVLGGFVLTSFESGLRKKDKCRKADIKNNVTKYVWERAKKALENGITERNTGISGGMFFVLNIMLEEMLSDKNIVDKDIANVNVINEDFSGVLKLVGDVLKSEYSDDHPIKMAVAILWNIKLSKITKEQNAQVDEVLKSLGLWFENGEIVIKDKNIFDKLPKVSRAKSEMKEVQKWVYRYMEEVRNGSKNTEMNKTDDKKENSEKHEKQNEQNENEREDENYQDNKNGPEEKETEDKKVDSINPEGSIINDNQEVIGPSTQKEETDNKPTYTNNRILEGIEKDQIEKEAYQDNKNNPEGSIINDNQEVIGPSTQKEETDNKPAYTNDQILKEIENAYRQDREIGNDISPDELWSAIENSKRYCYYSAMLSSENYDKIKKKFSVLERIAISLYRLIFFRFYKPKKLTIIKQPISNGDTNQILSERANTEDHKENGKDINNPTNDRFEI